MHSMVAKISHLEGQVEVINAFGQHRPLVAGDWLREGERIVAREGANVLLETTTGENVRIEGLQSMTLSAQLTADYMPHASDDAMNAQLLQHVLASLQAGESVLDLSSLLQGTSEFVAFAASTDHSTQTDALHIADLIAEPAPQQGHAMTSLTSNEGVVLIAATTLPSDIALQQQLLKDPGSE